jgi:hypothetical protein
MIPDQEAMITAAKKLEQVAHRRGWDAEPCLGLVHYVGEGYRTLPFPVQPHDLTPDVSSGLLHIADTIFQGSPEARQALTGQDVELMGALAAVWFVSEGWMTDKPRELREDQRIADIVGSKEVRFLVMIDCGGRLYFIDRIRGEKPTVDVVGPGQATTRADGNVVDALRRLLLAFGMAMPSDAVDLEAVSALSADGSPFTP